LHASRLIGEEKEETNKMPDRQGIRKSKLKVK
jgi:hypothetical protein